MSNGMELDGDLDPEALFQPLKRNHACLSCKKRKVRCDGVRPHCAPCLRSHAHACRASSRAGAKLPVLQCEWADVESPNGMGGDQDPLASMTFPSGSHAGPSGGGESRRTSASDQSGIGPVEQPQPPAARHQKSNTPPQSQSTARKASSNSASHGHAAHLTTNGSGHLNVKKAEREKEKRRDEERETLLARIADLEAKLAGMTTANGGSTGNGGQNGSMDEIMEEISTSTGMNGQGGGSWADVPIIPDHTAAPKGLTAATGNTAGTASYNFNAYIQPQNNASGTNVAGLLGNGEQSFDFSAFFLVPTNWPRNLPSPYLLEHLIDTFFQHVPQSPRMIHRAALMARLHHTPTHEDFPHPALLHAICASAASYTAWVHALPPEQLEAKVQEMLHTGADLETIADFALAQAEGARRAIHQSSNVCYWGAGRKLMDVLQAQVLMSEVYSQKGFTMLAWTLAAIPVRLIQGLELTNRNIPKRYKLGLLPVTQDPVEKEERLATVWQTYITDAFFAVGSYWQPSMDEREWYCKLPAASVGFKKGAPEPNSQGPNDVDVYRSHPVADPFVLMCKTAILAMRSARWRWQWAQREMQSGDEMSGMQHPEFQQLVRDIYEFQATMPLAIKNIFKLLDNGAHAFDANLLCIHIIPQVTLLMLYEQFADWNTPNSVAIMQMQRAYESIVGIVHLIPSNLDVSIIMNSMMCFAFYVAGRIIADFTFHALERGAYSLAVRHRADLMAIQGLLNRYGAKSPMGIFMGNFLESYLSTLTQGKKPEQASCRPTLRSSNDSSSGSGKPSPGQTQFTSPEEPPVIMPTYASASRSAPLSGTHYSQAGVQQANQARAAAAYSNAGSNGGMSSGGSMSGNTPESTSGSAMNVGPGSGNNGEWTYGFANFSTSVLGNGSDSTRPSTANNASPTTSTGQNSNNTSFDMRTPSDAGLAGMAFSVGGSFAPGAANGQEGHPPGMGWEYGTGSGSAGSPGQGFGAGGDAMLFGSTGMTPYLNFDTPEPNGGLANADNQADEGLELHMGMAPDQVDYALQFDRAPNAPHVSQNTAKSPGSTAFTGYALANAKNFSTLGAEAGKRAQEIAMAAHQITGSNGHGNGTGRVDASSRGEMGGYKGDFDVPPPMAGMTFATANGGLSAGMEAALRLQMLASQSVLGNSSDQSQKPRAVGVNGHVGNVDSTFTKSPQGSGNDGVDLAGMMGMTPGEMSIEEMLRRFEAENKAQAQREKEQQNLQRQDEERERERAQREKANVAGGAYGHPNPLGWAPHLKDSALAKEYNVQF